MKTKSYIPKRIYTVTKGKTQLYKIRQERIKLFTWKPIDPIQYGRSFKLWRGMGKSAGRWRFKPVAKRQPEFIKRKKTESFESPIDFESKAWKKYSKKFTNGFTYNTSPYISYDKGRRKTLPITSGQVNAKAFPVGRDKWGGSKKGKPRLSKNGKYNYWGPKGTQKPALIWDIRLDRTEFRKYMIKYMKEKGVRMSEIAIRNDIHKAMKVARRKFLQKTSRYIDTYVPKDTGTLRRTMKISLYKQPLKALISRIVMDTGDLQYAKPVNRMPSSMLQHDAYTNKVKSRGWYKNSKFVVNRQNHPGFNFIGYKNRPQERVSLTKAYKHDPKAQKNWWYLSVTSARAFARQAYKDFIEAIQFILTTRIYMTMGELIPIADHWITKEAMDVLDREFLEQTPSGMLRNREGNLFLPWDQQNDYDQYKHIFDYLVTTRRKEKIKGKVIGWMDEEIKIPEMYHATLREKKSEARKWLEKTPGIAEHFPGWITSFLGAKEAPYYLGTNFQKQHADFKIQEGKEVTQNSIQDELRRKSLRQANLRKRWTDLTVKRIITPTKTDIKRLFKVKFK